MSVLTIDIYVRNGLCVGVPRQLRIEFEGAMYHLVARGNRHEAIFRDDQDRQSFLCLLGDICVKASWKVHAYCFLDNHFHLVVETPIATLTSGMKWLLGVYTGRFNRRHQTIGHVFAGRYKSVVIDTQSGSYFQTACDYVHLNPARAKLLKPLEPLSSFQWASVRDYLMSPVKRKPWLHVNTLFLAMGIAHDDSIARREFERQLEARRLIEKSSDWNKVRRGWFLGGEDFRALLITRIRDQLREGHYAEQKQESIRAHAERIVIEELR